MNHEYLLVKSAISSAALRKLMENLISNSIARF